MCRHHDHATGVGEPAQHRHHLPVQRGIHTRRGFVQCQQRRFGQQLHRHRHALALPTRQFVDACADVLGHLEFFDHPRNHLLPFVFGGVGRHSQFGRDVQRLGDGEPAVHDVVLRDHADSAPDRCVLGVQIAPVERHGPTCRLPDPDDHLQQRGLARAGGADNRGQRARPGSEGNPIQQLHVAVLEGQSDVARLQTACCRGGLRQADEIAIVEDEVEVADRDDVVVGKRLRLDPLAVDECAIGAVSVLDLDARWGRHQPGVVP